MNKVTTVGLIGLGKMGFHMARNIADAGFRLLVDDLDPAQVERVVQASAAEPVADPTMWAEVDAVILMVPNSDVVEAVLGGGLIDSLVPGAVILDMSSSDPIRTRAIAGRIEAAGLRFVDAPVSGGVAGAQSGSLSIMVGGAEADLDSVRPVLEVLGSKILHVGPHGAGHAAKALNNLVSAVTLTVTAEALCAAERFGIDSTTMNAVLNASSGRSNTTERKVEQFYLSGTFGSGFTAALMAKDMRTSVALANELGIALPVGVPATEYWTAVAEDLGPEADHTRVFETIARPRLT